MNENLDPTNENLNPEELDLEKRLRPLSFDDFAGQDQILENLKVFVEAANQRNEALDHTLFHGPPGLGKTTLANILAKVVGCGNKNYFRSCSRQAWRFSRFINQSRRKRRSIY